MGGRITTSTARLLAAALLVSAAILSLMLPRLGATELRVEEGRRALAGRAMLEGEQRLVPTLFGRPYLSKPPLHPWVVAAASAPGGAVTPRSARLPSALASLALGLAVLGFGWRRLGARAALTAGLLLAAAPLLIEKGRLAEIEALLALCCFLSVAALGLALERRGAWPLVLGSGLALGAALLAKGPPALVFFTGAVLALALWDPPGRRRLLRVAGAALGLGLAIAGVWTVAMLASLPPADTLAHWGKELVGQGAGGLRAYLRERPRFAFGALMGMAPASLLLFASARRGLLRELRDDPRTRLALAASLPAALFFLVVPGTAPRYVFPILPWVALLGAARFEAVLSAELVAAPGRRTRALLLALAVLVGLAGLVCLVASAGGPGASSLSVGAGGLALVAGMLAAALLAVWRLRRADVRRGAALLLVALLALLIVNQTATDRRRSQRHQAHLAADIERHVPPDETLHVALWQEFNLLYLLDRRLRHLAAPSDAPAGAYVLVRAAELDAFGARSARSLELLHEVNGPRSGPLILLRTGADHP